MLYLSGPLSRNSVQTICALTACISLPVTLNAAYIFQDIINPGDPTFNQALGINTSGTISGYFGSGAAGHPNQGYVTSPPYTSFTSQNFPGSAQTQVVGINNSGATVGFYSNTNTGTDANAGFTQVGNTFTTVTNPSTPGGGLPVNQLLGVNNNNMAAGLYVDALGHSQGYIYNLTTMAFTPVMVMGANNSTATDINDAGVISGFYANGSDVNVGFIDNGGTFTFFQAFGDPTMFLGINNTGYAVGTYVDPSGTNHGVLYNIATGTFTTFDDPFAVSGPGNGTTLNGINDSNELVGFYVNADGNTIGLLADTPEPASLALMGLGLLALGFRAVRGRR